MAEQLRERPGDQPLPVPNGEPDIQSLVIADIYARRELGIQRYRTALQPFNHRDGLKDAYDEACDLTCYLRQLIAERDALATRVRPLIEQAVADGLYALNTGNGTVAEHVMQAITPVLNAAAQFAGSVQVPREDLVLVLNAIGYNSRVAQTLSDVTLAAAGRLTDIAKRAAEATP